MNFEGGQPIPLEASVGENEEALDPIPSNEFEEPANDNFEDDDK